MFMNGQKGEMNMKNVNDNDELVEVSKDRSELNNKVDREVNDMTPLFGASSLSEWSTMAYKTSKSDFQ